MQPHSDPRDHRPAFPINHAEVPEDFYLAVVEACGGPFADSYLWGGRLINGRFLPRTLTGWEKLTDSGAFQRVLADRKTTLVKPPPYAGPPAWKILGYPDPDEFKPKARRA